MTTRRPDPVAAELNADDRDRALALATALNRNDHDACNEIIAEAIEAERVRWLLEFYIRIVPPPTTGYLAYLRQRADASTFEAIMRREFGA
ncbi:hypothetical protein [Gordonia sp. NPDC003429]